MVPALADGMRVGQRLRQRAEHHVDDALRGLDVAGRHRARRPRVEHAALGRDHRRAAR